MLNPDDNTNVNPLESSNGSAKSGNNTEVYNEEICLKVYHGDNARIINNDQYKALYSRFATTRDSSWVEYFLDKEYVRENDYYGWYSNYGYLQKDLDLAESGDEQARQRVQNYDGYMVMLEDRRLPESIWEKGKKTINQAKEQVQQIGEKAVQGLTDSIKGIKDSTAENIRSQQRLWENINKIQDLEERDRIKILYSHGGISPQNVQNILFGGQEPTPDHPHYALYQAFQNSFDAKGYFWEDGILPLTDFIPIGGAAFKTGLTVGKYSLNAAKNFGKAAFNIDNFRFTASKFNPFPVKEISKLEIRMGDKIIQGKFVSGEQAAKALGKPVNELFPVGGEKVSNPLREVNPDFINKFEGNTVAKGTSKADYSLTRNQVDKLVNDIGGSIKKNPLRQEYEDAVSGLKKMEVELRSKGSSEEIIARELSQARRDLGVKYKELTPPELREYIYEVNTGRYKDPLGPKFDDLVKRYDGDYSKIIEAAQRPNPDVDNLLGGFKEWLIKKNGL